MRLPVLCLLLLAGCLDEVDPRWTLDHDHVIAARATPPQVRAGEGTALDALVAHEHGPVAVENPMTAEIANAPAALQRAVSQAADGRWIFDAPDAETLASARPAMGLPADAPVPVDVMLTFPNQSTRRGGLDPFKVKKTVWIGEPTTNPTAPAILVDGAPITDEVVVPMGRDVYIEVASPDPGIRVNWLTNVGTLYQDDVPRAHVHVLPEDRLEGELVLVVRDNAGGVDWRIFPMRAQ